MGWLKMDSPQRINAPSNTSTETGIIPWYVSRDVRLKNIQHLIPHPQHYKN
jgi:hypothetical protein